MKRTIKDITKQRITKNLNDNNLRKELRRDKNKRR